jgi:carbon storage regulator
VLLVSRLENQTLVIDENIEIKIVRVEGKNVCLGITAPKEKLIHRKEFLRHVKNAMKVANKQLNTSFKEVRDDEHE